MDEDIMDVTPEVVQPEEAAEDIEFDSSDTQEVEQTVSEPVQSAADNARFADMRRKQELDSARAELRQIRSEQQRMTEENRRLTTILNSAGYQGSAADNPEYVQLRQSREQLLTLAAEKIKSDDLAAIKAHNPRESIKAVRELGKLFGALRLQGVSAVDAYEAVRAVNARKQPPASMGDISGFSETRPSNKYAGMSAPDFEREIRRAERGELKKGF